MAQFVSLIEAIPTLVRDLAREGANPTLLAHVSGASREQVHANLRGMLIDQGLLKGTRAPSERWLASQPPESLLRLLDALHHAGEYVPRDVRRSLRSFLREVNAGDEVQRTYCLPVDNVVSHNPLPEGTRFNAPPSHRVVDRWSWHNLGRPRPNATNWQQAVFLASAERPPPVFRGASTPMPGVMLAALLGQRLPTALASKGFVQGVLLGLVLALALVTIPFCEAVLCARVLKSKFVAPSPWWQFGGESLDEKLVRWMSPAARPSPTPCFFDDIVAVLAHNHRFPRPA